MSKKVITFYDSEKQSHDFPIITPDYGTCSTASNTSAKVVTCDDFSLFIGAEITVKFTNAPTTDTITLNVNNSGAKNVDFSACGNKPYDEIKANGCYGFIYDGTSWIYKGSGKGASKEELERIKYYGDKDIIPSDESYFTVNETGETITGLTDTGKTQTELVIPYKINGVEITNLYSGNNKTSILNGATDKITKVVLSSNITNIGNTAFKNCNALTLINIPDSVTSIGNDVFSGCIGLTLINIPNGVTSIGERVFFNCTSLTLVNIPNNVTSIKLGTFANCNSLTAIEIPNSITNINRAAFANCKNLTIYCEQGSYVETYAKTEGFSVVYTDVKDIATETELERLKYYGDKDIVPSDESYFIVNATGDTITGLSDTGKTQTELVIPYKINGKKITTLYSGIDSRPPQSILYGSSTITKITIPKSVTTLGRGAFYDCNLTSINIPDSVTSIGYFAFQSCSSLQSINIPNSVTSIGGAAFQGCRSLLSIEIPNSITSIENSAFAGCANLTIYCEQGSYAEGYATVNDIPVMYTDISATDFDNKADKSTTLDGYGITDASHITTSQFDASTAANANLGDIHINTATGRVFICSYVNPGKEVLWTLLPITTSDINTDSDGYVLDVKTLKTKLSTINSALNEKIGTSSIVNDLKTNSALSVLSAAQGVVLKGLVDNKAEQVELERLKYYGDKDIVPSDESYFTVNATGETITGLTDTGKTQTELVIPYKINGKEITTLYSDGSNTSILDGNSVITKVVIPNSVTNIGAYAFSGCTSLASINIPNSVTSIEPNTFYHCTSLKSINIPNSVTSIGIGAFDGCTSLTSINIPNSVTSIGIGAFSTCTSLTSINIPNSVTSIGISAFKDCTSLTSISIPNSITSIGKWIFKNCTSLTSVNIPNSVTSIGNDAFSDITPSNLTVYCEQGSYAETYAENNNISVVYTDISATDFNNKADKATTISGYGITDAYTKGEIDSKISNVYKIKGSSTIANLPTNPDIGDVYNITDSGIISGTEIVVNAGDNVVYTSDGWDKLAATVDLSSYATETELERLKYYDDKDIIPYGKSYFTVNETGETITGLTAIGKLQTELVIPYEINGKKITTLFSGSDGISSAPVSILNGNSTITKVVIPKSVTTLGAGAFYNCNNLIDVNIPDSITSIGHYAFNGCTSLTSINIPNNVTSIGDYVFGDCTSLTSINIPNNVTSIGYYAFGACSSLTSINIPSSVTSVGQSAFDGCTGLTSINIPNSVTSIGNNAFQNCPNLTIYCEQDSYAETYAKGKNIPIVYTVVKDITSNKVTTITVPTTGWTTSTDTNGITYYTKNITNSILTSTGYPIADVVLPSDIAAARLQSEAYQKVNKITVNDGSVDLYCFDSLPTVSFQIRIQLLYI
ncbi:MAG: leucine-rich repeat domain-containing protein [Candidatus Onthovivens sp.]|nr:leucine-rich repeat domain-containing protein [Candidatus Onthovivens sp.]